VVDEPWSRVEGDEPVLIMWLWSRHGSSSNFVLAIGGRATVDFILRFRLNSLDRQHVLRWVSQSFIVQSSRWANRFIISTASRGVSFNLISDNKILIEFFVFPKWLANPKWGVTIYGKSYPLFDCDLSQVDLCLFKAFFRGRTLRWCIRSLPMQKPS